MTKTAGNLDWARTESARVVAEAATFEDADALLAQLAQLFCFHHGDALTVRLENYQSRILRERFGRSL